MSWPQAIKMTIIVLSGACVMVGFIMLAPPWLVFVATVVGVLVAAVVEAKHDNR